MDFDFAVDPFVHLDGLVKTATDSGLLEPNAMALATLSESRRPSVRIVLYKGLVRGGLSFYTNYEGRKGRELAHSGAASVCFFWPAMHTQVRVEGEVMKLSREESEAYFRTRARLSQIGAWASAQSEEIAGLEVLHEKTAFFEKKFAGFEVPCPPNWGGFHLVPQDFEFWFSRQGRLHERYCYHRLTNATWRTFMRSP